MRGERAAVYCDDCDSWVEVDPDRERVRCECGRSYVVTVTAIPANTVSDR